MWKAPAGTDATLYGVVNVAIDLDEDVAHQLSRRGINLMRMVPSSGIVVWQARTIAARRDPDGDYTYIPIRRLLLFLEESICRGTKWAVFEPNAEPLWSEIREATLAFLSELHRSGAFLDYFVNCDRSTMTQDDIDNGRINIEVGVAPVRPSEFTVISISQFLGEQATGSR